MMVWFRILSRTQTRYVANYLAVDRLGNKYDRPCCAAGTSMNYTEEGKHVVVKGESS